MADASLSVMVEMLMVVVGEVSSLTEAVNGVADMFMAVGGDSSLFSVVPSTSSAEAGGEVKEVVDEVGEGGLLLVGSVTKSNLRWNSYLILSVLLPDAVLGTTMS